MENERGYENIVKDTELRLGLPGSDAVRSNKRCSNDSDSTTTTTASDDHHQHSFQPSKVQVVGWPPIRCFRKKSLQEKKGDEGGIYVKVRMAGAPYLRKIDLKLYNSYPQLLNALQNLLNCTFGEYSEREGYSGSEYVPSYEDKDGDWMLVGDVPWDMFMSSCKRLRIMKGSEAKGLGCL